MAYNYDTQRVIIFTDRGQRLFLSIRDRTHRLIDMAGAVSMGSAISGESGDTWEMLACVDRLVELGEIAEVKMIHPVCGQNRLFVKHT